MTDLNTVTPGAGQDGDNLWGNRSTTEVRLSVGTDDGDIPLASELKIIRGVNAQTGTTYTAVLADAGKLVTMDNASANTFTIPTNASVAYATGTAIMVHQIGAGATTIEAATGVTLRGVSAGSGALSARWSAVTLIKTGTDAWQAIGDIGTVA